MNRKRAGLIAAAAIAVAAGTGTGIAVATSGSIPAASAPAAEAGPGYSWYRSMMGSRYGNGRSMMGGTASSR